MNEKLLPCPFCYKEPTEEITFGETPECYCNNFDCPMFNRRFTFQGWNTRVPKVAQHLIS